MPEAPPRRNAHPGTVVWGVVVAASLVVLFSKLRAVLRDREPAAGIDALVAPAAVCLVIALLVAAVWLRRHWR